MAENDFDRTEAPTARRRDEARQQGNIARSHDLTAAVALLAGIVLLQVLGQRVTGHLKTTVQGMLEGDGSNPARADDVLHLLWWGGRMFALTAGPLVAAISAATLLAALGQVGFVFTTRPLEPSFAKLSPWKGLGGLLGMRAGMRLVMSLAKVGAVLSVSAWIVMGDLPRIVGLPQLDAMPLFISACGLVYGLALKLASLLLGLAVLDYAFQYWQRERDLRMTRQEIKEEVRRMEGDPLIKQRRTRVARQLALQRLGQAVPRADMVVTNPTHFAVALRYDGANMRAPKVVAKGADFLALRIRQLALVHGVPLVERKDLARALYRGVEVGQEVPPPFYGAVAEILAYVYRLSGRKTA